MVGNDPADWHLVNGWRGVARSREVLVEHMNTPYERLKAIPDAAAALKPGLSFADLDAIAHAMTDNQAAEQLNRERGKLFQLIKSKKVA